MPRDVAVIVASFVWISDAAWIKTHRDALVARELMCDRSDGMRDQVSYMVGQEAHCLAHEPWFRHWQSSQILCIKCAQIVFPLVDKKNKFDAEAANWLLTECKRLNWSVPLTTANLEMATDKQLLLESVPHIAKHYVRRPSAEFAEVFGPTLVMSWELTHNELLVWYKKNPERVKIQVDKCKNGQFFVNVFTHEELEQHFGLRWALENGLVKPEPSAALERYFSQNRQNWNIVKVDYLNKAAIRMCMIKQGLDHAHEREREFVTSLLSRGLLYREEAQAIALSRRPHLICSRLIIQCGEEFWHDYLLHHKIDAWFLMKLAKNGINLSSIKNADQIARDVATDYGGQPHDECLWNVISLLEPSDECILDLFPEHLEPDFDVNRLRRLAAKCPPDKLWRLSANTAMMMSLARDTPCTTSVIDSLSEMLITWNQFKLGQIDELPKYVQCYQDCVFACDEGKYPEQVEWLHEEDAMEILGYALKTSRLEVVRKFMEDQKISYKHVVMGLCNPNPGVAELVADMASELPYSDMKYILCRIVECLDLKVIERTLKLLKKVSRRHIKYCLMHMEENDIFWGYKLLQSKVIWKYFVLESFARVLC